MKVAIRTARAVRVPIEHVKKNIGFGKSLNQLIRMIKPELQRQNRQKFTAAVIEMFPKGGRSRRVRFDESVQFEMKLREPKMKPEAVGKSFAQLGWTFEDVKDIKVKKNVLDPNAGHAFLVRMGEEFFLAFDFRYNRAIALRKIARAKEFVEGCKRLDPSKDYFLCCYALWSAYELLSDAVIISLPEGEISTKHPEKMVTLKKTRQGMKVVSDEFMKLFDRLSELKQAVRYPGRRTDARWKALNRRNSRFVKKAILIVTKELRSNVYFV